MSEKHLSYPVRLLRLPGGVDMFDRLGVVRSFRKDTILAEPDDLPTMCYVVKRGRVLTYEYTNAGEVRVYNFMEANSILLESNIVTNQPVTVYFKTAMPSELLCIEREALLSAIKEDARITRAVLDAASFKFLASMDQVRQACCHNATWRMCDLLIVFADSYGAPYDGKLLIQERISQQMLSNLLGINRVTAVRIIKELKDLMLIEQINGLYCIRSVERLRAYQNEVDALP